MKSFSRLILICAVFVPVALFSRSADAIPVFARKYKTACTTCHWSAFPKLNAFGMAFRARNYRIPPEDEIYVKDEPVSMGAEAYKKVFPNAVWPSDLPHLPAFSLKIVSDFEEHPRNSAPDTNFNGIGAIELLTAGTLGESFSWFGSLVLNEAADFEFSSNTEIERFYWQYTPRFFENPGFLSFRAGVFEVRAAPFRDHIRLLALTPSLADRFAVVPASNFHRMAKQAGIEVFGAFNGPGGRGGMRWAAGVVNGQPGGFGMFSSDAFNASAISNNVSNRWSGTFDINNSKDYYARINYKIGGMGVLGGSEETGLGSEKNWRDNSLTLGGFFYRGSTGFFRDPVNGTGFDRNGNRFWRFGGEATLSWWDFDVTGAATFYRDNTTDTVTIGTSSGDEFDVDIYTLRTDWVALPWVIPSFRFENVNPDYDAGDWPSFNRYSFDLTFLLRANIKVLMGGHLTSSDWKGPRVPAIDDTYRLGAQIAF